MRVVAGTARGRRLLAPSGTDVRPTSDRVREAVFNALGSLGAITGARVLDLYAGSGALGIEALSRGADGAVLVEHDRAAQQAIRSNLEATGLADLAEVVRGDATRYLEGFPPPFGLVLLDPPYEFAEWTALLQAVEGVVAPDTIVVIESDRAVLPPEGWRVERQKVYGGTFVAIARPPEKPPPSRTETR